MGWLKKKLKKAAKKVKKAVNKVAEAVADKIETAGNKIQDAAKQFGDSIAQNVPLVGGALGAVVKWFGAVASAICDIGGAAVKALGSGIGGLLAGAILLTGLDFKNGFREVFSGIVGGGLVFVGKIVSLVQTVFGAERRERRLTEKEVAMLKVVFRDSVALFNVRLIEGASGVFDFNDREFTLGNTIYMKRTSPADADWNETLVHEVTHVWQYQNVGSSYASDALAAQVYHQATDNSAYDWNDPDVNEGEMVWEDWNPEAQARFVDDLFTDGETSAAGAATWTRAEGVYYAAYGTPTLRRFLVDGTDHSAVAEAAVGVLVADASVRESLGLT